MKRKFKNIIIFLTLCFILLSNCMMTVFSKDSNVTFDENSKRFVFIPDNSDLFVNFKNIMPGDTLTQKIIVSNSEKSNSKVKIYLRADSVEEKYSDFLSKLHMTVTKDNKATAIFNSSAEKQDGLKDNVYLGTFDKGNNQTLDISLTIPIDCGNEFQNALGEIDWVFTAVEEPQAKPPQTGYSLFVIFRYVVYGIISLLFIIINYSLKLKRRRIISQ